MSSTMSTISALASAVSIVPALPNNANNQSTTGSNSLTTSNNTPTTNNNSYVATSTNSSNTNSTFIGNLFNEEKVYKKEKQILLEFESKTKDLKSQLNEGTKCLEQRLDTQISLLYELQDFFKKRAEVELQYSRDLDKLNKQIYARHKSEKTKRETWHLHSTSKLWEALLNDTKQHSKYHQVAGEISSKYVADKFDDIIEDIKRIFTKCKGVGQSAHEEIFKVVGELNGAMKTYHEYQSESKQAEAKLKYVQSQKPKFEKQKSKKKLKQYEKQVEKRLQKYTETKVKAFKARNEYILSIDSANACINKFCNEDIGDLVDCMDFGFHASVAKCIYMYLSAQENIKRSRQLTVDNISRSIGDLDSNADKQNYLDYFSFVFNIQKKFQFEPHKGDEVSQVNAQSLIRYEMEKRFEQLDNRLKTIKAENDEIFKTIEATEQSLLNYFDVKNCDMSDLFRDLNLTNQNTSMNKIKRIEIEDYYVEKVRQFTTSSNLIARLEARHSMMQKALCGCVNNSDKLFEKMSDLNSNTQQKTKKKIGKSPIIGQPRLFGGKLIEYINATKQEIPQIITSCIKAINRLGLHNQGIFRIPGSQLEINQFKEAFEKGEDPLITVNPREMNSVAGVLKLYLRELKDPLFPREMYDTFLNAMRISTSSTSLTTSGPGPVTSHTSNTSPVVAQQQQQQSQPTSSLLNDDSFNFDFTNISLSPVENIEAIKVENIRKAMSTVIKPIFIVLRYLFSFLNHLSEFKDENMMDSYNIAICLAPTLIPVPEDKKDQVNHQTDTIELIKLIIQHSDQIFSMECDGPVYEKFDSEMDNDEENIEESEEEEEEESERQIARNISDDETYATEAIALYDYKGRTEKELSFKKGSVLAIRGQLSADWWQGSILYNQNSNSSTNTNNNNTAPSSTPKLGYIPDKYIALRTCSKRKKSNSVSMAPPIIQNTPNNITANNLNSNRLNSQSPPPPVSQINSYKLTSSNIINKLTNKQSNSESSSSSSSSSSTSSNLRAISAANLEINNTIDLNVVNMNKPANLSEHLFQVKESDILNDEENEGILNNCNNNAGMQTKNELNNYNGHHQTVADKIKFENSIRSPSNYISYNKYNSCNPDQKQSSSVGIIRRRISSSSSNSVVSDSQNNNNNMNTNHNFFPPPSYLTLNGNSHQNNNTSCRYKQTIPNQINNTSLDDLLLNNRHQLKINHIEDALASVLDDMKQLDFSTNTSSSIKANNATAQNNPPSYKINGIKTNGHLNAANNILNRKNFTAANPTTMVAHENALEEVNNFLKLNKIITNTSALGRNSDLLLKQQFKTATSAAIASVGDKRPDLVIDLPLNMSNAISLSSSSSSSPPITGVDLAINTRKSLKSTPISKNGISAIHGSETKSRRLSMDQLNTQNQLTSNNNNNTNTNNTTQQIINNDELNAKEQLQSSSTSSTESSSIQSQSSSQSSSSNLLQQNNNKKRNSITFLNNNQHFKNDLEISNSISTTSNLKHQSCKIVNLPAPHAPVVLLSTNNLLEHLFDQENSKLAAKSPISNAELTNQKLIIEENYTELSNISNDDSIKTSEDNLSDLASSFLNNKPDTNILSNSFDSNGSTPNNNNIKKQPPPLMKKPDKSDDILRKLGRSPQQQNSESYSSSSTSSTSTVSSLSSSSSPVNNSNNTSKNNLSMRLTNSKATDV